MSVLHSTLENAYLSFYRHEIGGDFKLLESPKKKRNRRNCIENMEDCSGGNLRISNGKYECLLSIRGIKKLIKPFSEIDDMVEIILSKRPYLS